MIHDFSQAVTCFFTDYLSSERGVSRHTLRSYGAAFASFLEYMQKKKSLPAEKIKLIHFNRENVLGYLDWIETSGSGPSTRNQRMAALHSFCKFMQYKDVSNLQQWQDILSIKTKKAPRQSVNYLTLDGIKALLAQIPQTTMKGRRDLAILSVLYETGARVQELVDLRPMDLNLIAPAHITLFGKGSKKRNVPVQPAVVNILKQYLSENHLDEPRMNHRPLFQNYRGGKMTSAGITYILKEYAAMARAATEGLIPDRISPHCLRHSKAMHLLQAGINLVYIRDILGHVSIQTTEIYARADSKLKREALEKSYISVLPSITDDVPSWERESGLKEWLKGLGK